MHAPRSEIQAEECALIPNRLDSVLREACLAPPHAHGPPRRINLVIATAAYDDHQGMKDSASNGKRNLSVAVALAAIAGMSFWFWMGRSLALPSANASQVRVTIFSNPELHQAEDVENQEPQNLEFQTSDSTAILKLVAALEKGQPCDDHKCAPAGSIQLSYPSGDLLLHFLPGHTAGFYEVRRNGKPYSLPHDSFAEALAACGVPLGSIPR